MYDVSELVTDQRTDTSQFDGENIAYLRTERCERANAIYLLHSDHPTLKKPTTQNRNKETSKIHMSVKRYISEQKRTSLTTHYAVVHTCVQMCSNQCKEVNMGPDADVRRQSSQASHS